MSRVLVAIQLLACAPTLAVAQALKVGDVAPEFTVTTVTARGVESTPFRLSEHRGETVILAFFPKARTSGCTTQMEAYRDRYTELFHSGAKVTLIGVSTDDTRALVGWAQEKQFPFRFASDGNKAVGKAYGANSILWHKRHLYVIDPAGTIAYIATPFRQMSEDAYAELGRQVTSAGSAK